MNVRLAWLAAAGCGLLLTGCPLTDHYELMSDLAPKAGSDAGGSDSNAGSSAQVAGSGGADEGGFAGEAPSTGGAGTGGMSTVAGNGGADPGGAGGSGGFGGAVDACQNTCSASQTCCDTKCVDLKADAVNCGACGNACNAGRTCMTSVCTPGWLSMSSPPTSFVGRSRAAAVAIDGGRVFIWGGMNYGNDALGDGAIYDPRDNTWKVLGSATGSPSARVLPSVVWTGKVVIVFGGADAAGNNSFRDGALYDPAADAWTALNPPQSVTRRAAPYAFWDGSTAVFWGGTAASGSSWTGSSGGERFDLTSWSNLANNGDPGLLGYPAVAFNGSVMYLSGGSIGNNRQDKAWSYDITNNRWAALPNGGPSSRSTAFGVWDGSRFVVWGGRDDNGLRSDGKYLSGTTWTSMSTQSVPSARMVAYRRSGWAFQVKPGVVAIMGGQNTLSFQATLATNGAIYDVSKAAWTGIPEWPSGEAHDGGIGVWTGQEFVIWGGRNWNGASNSGQRWAPAP